MIALWLFGVTGAQDPSDDERSLLAQIQGYDEQIVALDGQIRPLADRLAAAKARSDAQAADVARANTEIARGRTRVQRLVRAYYVLARRGPARLLFDAEDPTELRRRVRYLWSIVHSQAGATLAFARLVSGRSDAETKNRIERETLAEITTELEAHRASLTAERQQRVGLINRIRSSGPLAAQASAEKSRAIQDFDRSVLTHEATAPASVTQPAAAAFRAAKGALPAPVSGRVIGTFGAITTTPTGESLANTGIDIAAPPGTPFRAVFAGTVTRSGYVRGYGQVVMVQHGAYTTLYAHASGLRVAQGAEVQAGDVLGLVGSTGLFETDEPRLHFEIRYNGTAQDPAQWLGA